MESAAPGDLAVDRLIEQHVPFFGGLAPADQERLRAMAASLRERGLPPAFVGSSLLSTAEVLRELREAEGSPDDVFQREHVRQFIAQNAVPEPQARVRFNPRRERKREERERLHSNAVRLLREARAAHGRHEVKKTRNMLLKLDQRELRRVLGKEGEDLCRQINIWLRSTAAMF